MKKVLVMLLALSLLAIGGIPAFAADSGSACYYHNGINCLAGPDVDGSVICNDGWTASSVAYSKVKSICGDDYRPFSDVDPTNEYNEAIVTLYEKQVIIGYPDQTFKPYNFINRAEFLKILIEGNQISLNEEAYNNCFPDVTDDWYAPYVCYAKEQGWIEGYPDGEFKATQNVNKAESIKMIIQIHDYTDLLPEVVTESKYADVSVDDWFAPYVEVAYDKALIIQETSYLNPADYMTRAGITEMTYRSMMVKENNLDTFLDYDPLDETVAEPIPEITYSSENRSMGEENAPIVITEYSEYQCPFCKRQHDEVIANLKTDYIATGDVYYEFKDFPLPSIHSNSESAALAASCAQDQGAYWEMHNILYENQSAWSSADDPTDEFTDYAEYLGLNVTDFGACLSEETHLADIEADKNEGIDAGVIGTPSMIINGELILGLQDYETLSAYLDALLEG